MCINHSYIQHFDIVSGKSLIRCLSWCNFLTIYNHLKTTHHALRDDEIRQDKWKKRLNVQDLCMRTKGDDTTTLAPVTTDYVRQCCMWISISIDSDYTKCICCIVLVWFIMAHLDVNHNHAGVIWQDVNISLVHMLTGWRWLWKWYFQQLFKNVYEIKLRFLS